MIKSEIISHSREDSKYPPALKVHLADQAPDVVTSFGNASL